MKLPNQVSVLKRSDIVVFARQSFRNNPANRLLTHEIIDLHGMRGIFVAYLGGFVNSNTGLRTTMIMGVVCVVLAQLDLAAIAVTPAAPANLRATAVSTSRIELTWVDMSSNESGFKIYRAESSTGPWSNLGSVGANVTGYSNKGLASNKTYYYKVRAFNRSGNSAYTDIASARTFKPNLEPPPPTDLAAVTVCSTRINLTWNQSSTNETGFVIERSFSSAGPWTPHGTSGAGITYFYDTGLIPQSNYFYRVSATNAMGVSAYSKIVSAQTDRAGQGLIKGIYLLDSRSGTNRLGQLPLVGRRSWIDGFAWRMDWLDFDPGTTGPAYDFSPIAAAITNLQAMDKQLSLRLKLELVPKHVLSSAHETYVTTFIERNITNHVRTVVPWDAPAFIHYTNFLHALAEYRVLDSSTGNMVPLRAHPTLATMRVCVLGRDHVARDGFDDLVKISSYTRNKYIQAVLNCIRAAQTEFPSTILHIGYFSLSDTHLSPPLDTDLLAAIDSTFDGRNRPRLGFFQEVLTGDKPDTSGTYGENLLIARDSGSPVMFQSVGAWTNHSPGDWSPGDDSPENGFFHGFGRYGAVYYELYPPDLFNPDFDAVFDSWHTLFQSIRD